LISAVEDIRPAFLSAPTLQILNPLRSFRHFVRHAYGSDIKSSQRQANLALALAVRDPFSQDMACFLETLTPIVDSTPEGSRDR